MTGANVSHSAALNDCASSILRKASGPPPQWRAKYSCALKAPTHTTNAADTITERRDGLATLRGDGIRSGEPIRVTVLTLSSGGQFDDVLAF